MSRAELVEVSWVVAENLSPATSPDSFFVVEEITGATIIWRGCDQTVGKAEVTK